MYALDLLEKREITGKDDNGWENNSINNIPVEDKKENINRGEEEKIWEYLPTLITFISVWL